MQVSNNQNIFTNTSAGPLFDALPFELTQEILKYLPLPDATEARLVCKQFSGILSPTVNKIVPSLEALFSLTPHLFSTDHSTQIHSISLFLNEEGEVMGIQGEMMEINQKIFLKNEEGDFILTTYEEPDLSKFKKADLSWDLFNESGEGQRVKQMAIFDSELNDVFPDLNPPQQETVDNLIKLVNQATIGFDKKLEEIPSLKNNNSRKEQAWFKAIETNKYTVKQLFTFGKIEK